MSPATENLILLSYLALVVLSLPVAIVLTRKRRAALTPPPLPQSVPTAPAAAERPLWMTPEGIYPAQTAPAPTALPDDPYFPPQAEILAPAAPVAMPLHAHWRKPDVWFALILAFILAVLMGPVLSGPQAMEGVDFEMTNNLFIGQLVFHAAVIGIIMVYLGVFRRLEPFKVFGIGNKGPAQTVGIALLWIIIAFFGLGLIGAALMPVMEAMTGGELKQQMIVEKGMQITDPATRMWMFVTLAVGAPLMEEIVFRGIFFSVAARFTHPVYAAISSGAFFAVIHNSLYALVPLTILGSVFAWAYHKTRTLAVPVVMHSIFNATQFLILFYGPPELRQ